MKEEQQSSGSDQTHSSNVQIVQGQYFPSLLTRIQKQQCSRAQTGLVWNCFLCYRYSTALYVWWAVNGKKIPGGLPWTQICKPWGLTGKKKVTSSTLELHKKTPSTPSKEDCTQGCCCFFFLIFGPKQSSPTNGKIQLWLSHISCLRCGTELGLPGPTGCTAVCDCGSQWNMSRWGLQYV